MCNENAGLLAGVFVSAPGRIRGMSETPTPPQYEPGGDRIMIVIAVIVVTALGGMAWSFFSRQDAPADAPEIKARHLPPSARPPADKPASQNAVPPAPTFAPAK